MPWSPVWCSALCFAPRSCRGGSSPPFSSASSTVLGGGPTSPVGRRLLDIGVSQPVSVEKNSTAEAPSRREIRRAVSFARRCGGVANLSACRQRRPGPSPVTAGPLGCQWTAPRPSTRDADATRRQCTNSVKKTTIYNPIHKLVKEPARSLNYL